MAHWVILEGIDGAGKSTLVHWLHERFKSIVPAVWKVSETCNYDVSRDQLSTKLVRRASVDKDLFRSSVLFSAARILLPASYPFHDNFDDEVLIFRDRCFLSTVAYQMEFIAKQLAELRGLDTLDTIRWVLFEYAKRSDMACHDPALVIVLQVDPEVSYARQSAYSSDLFLPPNAEVIRFLSDVSENYFSVVRDFGDYLPNWTFAFVNANCTLSELCSNVERIVFDWLDNRRFKYSKSGGER